MCCITLSLNHFSFAETITDRQETDIPPTALTDLPTDTEELADLQGLLNKT